MSSSTYVPSSRCLTSRTYKYIHGSSSYDTKRAPAYTDRILFRSPLVASNSATPGPGTPAAITSTPVAGPSSPSLQLRPTHITCDRYGSHDVRLSDHRPVSGTYTSAVRVRDEEKRAKVVDEIRRELERLEIVYKPGVQLGRKELHFGEIRSAVPSVYPCRPGAPFQRCWCGETDVGRYRQVRTESIRLTNAGRVPASLSFKSVGPKDTICMCTPRPARHPALACKR